MVNQKQKQIKKVTPTETLREKIYNDVFSQYFKVESVEEGYEPNYANVTLNNDFVDMYSLVKLQETQKLTVRAIKVNIYGNIVFSVELA